ncbi:restriction endonuclease subunit S [Fructilactobacillus sp. Tb1]|uniref:restriction endonuclease subunit S n=1 Tax=Fructilactobacillus sp. Tb1 TaxID=3422304 RepID=UPI003D2696F9
MKNEEITPRIRFKGFYDAWEQRKLGDVVSWNSGNGISKSELSNNGKNKVIHYADLYKMPEIISKNNIINYSDSQDGVKIKTNSILFPKSDVTSSGLARTSSLSLPEIFAGGDVLIGQIDNNISSKFISFEINKNRKSILKYVTGSTIRHISSKSLSKLDISIPVIKEQIKIYELLDKLNKLIDANGVKHAETQRMANFLRNSLLDESILVENCANVWNNRKLSKIFEIKNGKSQKKVEVKDGKYPILATGGEIGRTNIPLYSESSVLIGRKGTIDKPKFIDEPFWTVDTLFYTRIFDKYVPKFIYYVTTTINWKKYDSSTSLPSLTTSSIYSISVKIPDDKNEQQVIADLLTKLDKLTNNYKTKIEKLKTIKQYLMQNMFI